MPHPDSLGPLKDGPFLFIQSTRVELFGISEQLKMKAILQTVSALSNHRFARRRNQGGLRKRVTERQRDRENAHGFVGDRTQANRFSFKLFLYFTPPSEPVPILHREVGEPVFVEAEIGLQG
jgi:hypothetical protein